jgi:hypothetical protein
MLYIANEREIWIARVADDLESGGEVRKLKLTRHDFQSIKLPESVKLHGLLVSPI